MRKKRAKPTFTQGYKQIWGAHVHELKEVKGVNPTTPLLLNLVSHIFGQELVKDRFDSETTQHRKSLILLLAAHIQETADQTRQHENQNPDGSCHDAYDSQQDQNDNHQGI